MINSKSLAERMVEGRMPVAEALHCALQLGEALRRIHDAGQFHGAVTPANIAIGAAGAELLPAQAGLGGEISPYTAPEILQGRPADARSDIFAFGAILFEMLTGSRAFEVANLSGPTPFSGSPVADRLIAPCLSANPDTRTPRMQRVLMELKLLSSAARRAEAAAAPVLRCEPGVDAGVTRGEMQHLELRLAARIADVQRWATEVASAPVTTYEAGIDAGIIRGEMRQIEARLAARLASHERAVAEIQRSAAEAAASPLTQYDSGIDAGAIRGEIRQIEARVAARLVAHERAVAEIQRSAEAAASPLAQYDAGLDAGIIRNEMRQIESRLAARLAAHERMMADVQRSVAEAAPDPAAHYDSGLDAGIIRNEVRQIESRLAARLAAQERSVAEIQRSAAEVAAAPAAHHDSGIDAGIIRNEIRQIESRLATRLAAHERSVAEIQRSVAEVVLAPAAQYDSGMDVGAIRNEMRQIESRLAARLATHERAIAEIQRSAAEDVGTLKDQFLTLGAQLAAAQTQSTARPESEIDGAQIDRIEKTVEDLRQHAAQFERSVAADLVDIEQGLKVQSASIESARTAMSQTDDLVERVVEALESLQTAVLDSGEPVGERAKFAVN